jgi:hypothetical protein
MENVHLEKLVSLFKDMDVNARNVKEALLTSPLKAQALESLLPEFFP